MCVCVWEGGGAQKQAFQAAACFPHSSDFDGSLRFSSNLVRHQELSPLPPPLIASQFHHFLHSSSFFVVAAVAQSCAQLGGGEGPTRRPFLCEVGFVTSEGFQLFLVVLTVTHQLKGNLI